MRPSRYGSANGTLTNVDIDVSHCGTWSAAQHGYHFAIHGHDPISTIGRRLHIKYYFPTHKIWVQLNAQEIFAWVKIGHLRKAAIAAGIKEKLIGTFAAGCHVGTVKYQRVITSPAVQDVSFAINVPAETVPLNACVFGRHTFVIDHVITIPARQKISTQTTPDVVITSATVNHIVIIFTGAFNMDTAHDHLICVTTLEKIVAGATVDICFIAVTTVDLVSSIIAKDRGSSFAKLNGVIALASKDIAITSNDKDRAIASRNRIIHATFAADLVIPLIRVIRRGRIVRWLTVVAVCANKIKEIITSASVAIIRASSRIGGHATILTTILAREQPNRVPQEGQRQ